MHYQTQTPTLSDFIASLDGTPQPIVLLEGSREVPEVHRTLLVWLGALLAEKLPQARFRSGNADGSDSLFAEGVSSVDPSRMQVITPTAGHRKKNLRMEYDVVSLGQVSEVHEEELAYASNSATPKNASLMAKRKEIPRLGAKARYLLRDTLKVIGDPEKGLAPANVGIFYTKPDPMAGGTGHTIRVCQQEGVPVVLFAQWKAWA